MNRKMIAGLEKQALVVLMEPRKLAALAVEHASESKRLIALKSSGDRRHDPAFHECEERVQRLEIDLMKATGEDATRLALSAADLRDACAQLIHEHDEGIDGDYSLELARVAIDKCLNGEAPKTAKA